MQAIVLASLPAPRSTASPSLTQALAALGSVRRFRKGSLLIQEGDVGDTLFIIQSGRLRVFSADDRDREITLGVYGPGDYVGEMALDGGPRSATVEALEASVCSVVTRQVLMFPPNVANSFTPLELRKLYLGDAIR